MSEFLVYATSSQVIITSACLLNDEVVAYGTKSGDVVCFNIKEKKELYKVSFGNLAIESLSYNGQFLVASYADTCGLVDAAGQIVHTLKFPEPLKQALLTNDNFVIAATKEDLLIRRSLEESSESPSESVLQMKTESSLNGIAVSESLLAVALGSGHIALYNPETLQLLHKFGAHSINAYGVALHGNTLVSGGGDALGTLFRIENQVTAECVKTFGQLEWPVRACAVHSDKVAFGSDADASRVRVGLGPLHKKNFRVFLWTPA